MQQTNISNRQIRVFQTVKDTGERLQEVASRDFQTVPDNIENQMLNVFPDVRYQEVEGFGGAFTEAGAVTLAQMSPEKQREIVNAYFHPETGNGYSLCRTHINSCDFSLGNYTYVEDNDIELSSFDISRDQAALIPFIKMAQAVEGASFNLFSSPWSPPGWMKSNGQMNEGGSLLPQYHEAWANYYVKYIRAYEREGIPIWGITVQNEAKAVQRWDSCILTAEQERDFVKNFLGPLLEREALGELKVMIWDHNKERIYDRAKIPLEDPEASKYIWGVGFHWYSGDHFGGLEAVHHHFPDKKLIFTEGCVEKGVHFGDWSTGERYAHQMIGDLNHWCAGWVDWNLLLDETGGPNHVGNFCDAPIIADRTTDTVHYQSSFYYMGHFSRFIRPGAVRVGCSVYTDLLECTAFQNPDGQLAVVILNRSNDVLPYLLRLGTEIVEVSSPPHSIQTILI